MADKVKILERINNMTKIEKTLEKMDSLNDLNTLYRKTIQAYLDEITTDSTLQKQIKSEMGIV